MNKITGKIAGIQSSTNLSLIEIASGENKIHTVILEIPSTLHYLKIGHEVSVLFKETEVIVSKNHLSGISLQNQIEGKVIDIERGDVLSRVEVNTASGKICSIITTQSLTELNLKSEDTVYLLINTNEIMLSE